MAHVSFPWRSVPAAAMASVFLVLAGDSETATGIPGAVPSQVLAERDSAAANRLLQGAPSPFVPNLGQWEHPANFVHRAGGMTMFLEDRGWTLSLVEPVAGRKKSESDRLDRRHTMPEPEHQGVRGAAIRMTFEGDDRTPGHVGESKLPGVYNYFLGNDPRRWRTDVPQYASVRYRQLYEGIDVRVRCAGAHPEYDLLVSPGADPARVRIRVDGADGLRLTEDGSLVMDTAIGPVTQPVPETWEATPHGERIPVDCAYRILDRDVFGFDVYGWDARRELTIDPGLLWSTYLGGSGAEIEAFVTADQQGVVTVAIATNSVDFPTTLGAYRLKAPGGLSDLVVSVLDPRQTGSAQLVYSTYIGGSEIDWVTAVTRDGRGIITITGHTRSTNFPATPNAFAATYAGGGGPSTYGDVFVVQLDERQVGLAQLIYSTYLGGSGDDIGFDVSVGADFVVTLVGQTGWGQTNDFPTTPGAFDPTYNGNPDAFISKLDLTKVGAAQLVYSTYFGGGQTDLALNVVVEKSGVVTAAGSSNSRDLITTPGALPSLAPGNVGDVFVCTLDLSQAGTAQLRYSTYLGGIVGSDSPSGLCVDGGGIITVTGTSRSFDFPTTPNAFDRTYNGFTDSFVSRLDPMQTGTAQLLYSTFFGGPSGDKAKDLFVDTSGVVTIAGWAGGVNRTSIPTTQGAYLRRRGGQSSGGFITRLDPSQPPPLQLLYSTYTGADGQVDSLAVGGAGEVTVAGMTYQPEFPTTPGAYRRSPIGSLDAFVARLDMLPTGVSTYGASSPGCTGPLAMSVSSWPQAGNAAFSLTCNNAPPSSVGVVLLGASALTTPFPFLGVDLWVDPAGAFFLALPTASNPIGAADFEIPLPLGTAGGQLAAQFVWFGPSSPPPCPPGAFSASNALDITIQP